jgi:hypothetical protein
MKQDPGPPATGLRAYLRPWPLLLCGLGLTVVGLVLSVLSVPPLQALCIAAGLLTAGVALGRHLRTAKWDFPDRLESAGLTGLLGVTGAVAYFALLAADKDWDTARLFCAVLVLVSMVGALLILLPSLPRRVVISLFIVFHFVGIVSTITAGDPGPWWSKQLYWRVYHRYLTFIYMTNRYQFYAPEPGAPILMWFAVHYSDETTGRHTYKWVKLPERDHSPIGMHYQRMLALPQHVFVSSQSMPHSERELARPGLRQRREAWEEKVKDEKRFKRFYESWETLTRRRELGSTDRNYSPRIPVVYGLADNINYTEPTENSKKLISSVARYIFHNPPPPPSPAAYVTSVKVYRVIHTILSPAELARGVDPRVENRAFPYFMGEFDGEGTMLNEIDPFLYWYLPIVKVPLDYEEPKDGLVRINVMAAAPANFKWLDCVEIHAARPYKAEKKR